MALFEKHYRNLASTEIEKTLRELEKSEKNIKTKADKEKLSVDVNSAYGQVGFAQNITVIGNAQAQMYRDRLHEITKRTEFERNDREIVDSLENPREREHRYYDMDSYNAQIARERASKSVEAPHSSAVEIKPPSRSDEERVR